MNLPAKLPSFFYNLSCRSSLQAGNKPRLMNLRNLFNKAIILSVFVLAGFLLARSLYYGSFIGIVCAIIGMIAWTMFLYRLSHLQTQNEKEEVLENT